MSMSADQGSRKNLENPEKGEEISSLKIELC
jgi:hypothetical protein